MTVAVQPSEVSERKVVTVLFADLRNSLALIAGRDPESADELLGRGVEIMSEAVRRHSGTIVKVMGDGILVLFGAPRSIEHHAAQACMAALEIRRSILASPVSVDGGSTLVLSVRVGVNSGEVVFKERIVGGTLAFEASGEVVHLAARMEQIAPSNAILITEETLRDISAFFQTRALGEQHIKGLDESRRVFELIDENATPNRFSGPRHLPCIGRDEPIARLRLARTELAAGKTRIIKIVGEAGIGKSRLISEAISPATDGYRTVFGQCLPFKRHGYQLISSLLMSCLGIEDPQPWSISLEDLRGRLALLGCAQATDAVALMMGSVGAEIVWREYSPAERRAEMHRQVTEVLAAAASKGMVCILEDLQWLDDESEEQLKAILCSRRSWPALFILSTRLEPSLGWLPHDGLVEVSLEPLGDGELELALRERFDGDNVGEVVSVLLRRAAGNPLFLDAMISSLIYDGRVTRVGEKLRLSEAITGLSSLPQTIRELLAARVDRLTPLDKQVLQAAAVVGLESTEDLLIRVAGLSAGDLEAAISRLRAMDFLRIRMAGRQSYRFCHELMREAVYAGILLKRRREIHLLVVDAIRMSVGDNETAVVEDLAEHARRGENWIAAAHYAQRAAKKSIALDANTEAVYFLDSALDAASHWEDQGESGQFRLDVHLMMRDPLFRLGRLEAIRVQLERAENLYEVMDWRQRGLYYLQRSHYFTLRGRSADALAECGRAQNLAHLHADPALIARAQFQEGLERFQRWELAQSVDTLTNAVAFISANLSNLSYGLQRGFDVSALSYIVRAEAELGLFSEARGRIDEMLEIAHKRKRAFESFFACLAVGHLQEVIGEPMVAATWLAKAEEWCDVGGMPLLSTIAASHRGLVMARSGLVEAGISKLQSVRSKIETMQFHGQLPFCLTALAEAYAGAGDWVAAQSTAELALTLSTKQDDFGAQGSALLLMSRCAQQTVPANERVAMSLLQQAIKIAERLSLLPLAASCRRQASVMGFELA